MAKIYQAQGNIRESDIYHMQSEVSFQKSGGLFPNFYITSKYLESCIQTPCIVWFRTIL